MEHYNAEYMRKIREENIKHNYDAMLCKFRKDIEDACEEYKTESFTDKYLYLSYYEFDWAYADLLRDIAKEYGFRPIITQGYGKIVVKLLFIDDEEGKDILYESRNL